MQSYFKKWNYSPGLSLAPTGRSLGTPPWKRPPLGCSAPPDVAPKPEPPPAPLDSAKRTQVSYALLQNHENLLLFKNVKYNPDCFN